MSRQTRNLAVGAGAVVAALVITLVWWRSKASQAPAAPGPGTEAPAPPRRAADVSVPAPPASPWLDRDEDPVGTQRLEGQVIDGDELPVAGAVVGIDSVPPRTATTEDDGSFAFDRLTPRSYRLVAYAGDQTAGPVDARLTATSEPVILRVRRAAIVRATVVDASTQRAIGGAAVQLRGLVPRGEVTGSDGIAELRGVGRGDYVVVVAADGYATERRAIEAAGAPDEVVEARFSLRAGASASGVVVSETGAPVPGARVVAEEVSRLFTPTDPRLDAVETDAAGAWRIDALAPGTYRFHARHPDHAPAVSALTQLERGDDRTGISIALSAPGRIRGTVADAGGAPVPSAVVRVTTAASVATEPTRQTFSDERGAFDLRGLPRKQLVVVATSETASSELHPVDLAANPDQTGVTLTLSLTGGIAGVVVDSAGTPVPEALVRAVPTASTDSTQDVDLRLRRYTAVIADSGGQFAFRGLPDATYLLRAGPPGSARDALWLQAPVEAHPGDEHVRIVLRPAGSITGRVAFEDGSSPELFTARIRGGVAIPFAPKDGAFALRDVPPGTQSVELDGPEFMPTEVLDVAVEPGKTEDLGVVKVARGRVVSGRVLGEGGAPIADAQVVMARELFGDGQTVTTIENGGGILLKQTASGPDGRYAIRGVPPREMTIIADRSDVGRSTPITIPVTHGDTVQDLVLQPFGALEGAVTMGGEPAEGAVVGLRSRAAPNLRNTLVVGPDGSYRFDRIAAGEYLVFAFLESGGQLSGAVSESVAATVEPGKTARVFIDLPVGGVTLSLFGESDDARIKAMYLVIALGDFEIKPGMRATIDEMRRILSDAGGGAVKEGFTLRGKPIVFENVLPGTYAACGVGIAADPDDAAAMNELFQATDRIYAVCSPIVVSESPDEQSASVPIELADPRAEPEKP